MPTPTVAQTLSDPNFQGLPLDQQKVVLGKLDPNFGNLPPDQQDLVIGHGKQSPPTQSTPGPLDSLAQWGQGKFKHLAPEDMKKEEEAGFGMFGAPTDRFIANSVTSGAKALTSAPAAIADWVAGAWKGPWTPGQSANQMQERAQGGTPMPVTPPPVTAEQASDYGSDLLGKVAAGAVIGKAAGLGLKAVGKVASKGKGILTGGTKAASELNTSTLADNAKISDANQAATTDFNQKTAEAQHATEGRELGYKQAVNTKAEDIAAQDAVDQAKLAGDYQAQIAEARGHNQRVLDKHKTVTERLNQQNEATNQTLGLRQQQQADLDDMTQKYFAQEDAAKANAKGQENAAWQPWRQKMQGVMIDGDEIAAPLQKISMTSPDVARALRQLQPPPSEAPMDSNYAQDRAAIMKSLGYKGDYFELPETARTTVDKIATSNGFEPDPIDFDPQPGKPIPVDLVHRANSILQSYIRNGRYEGPILGEMKQVAKVLRAAVSRASTEAGALPDLTAAREATVKYQDAFGRDRYQPQTQDDIREQQANPEAYKERDDEERLAKAAQFDPTLVDSFRGVKAARENLKNIPSEDTLRKGLKQVPKPPTVGDIRPGYSLLAEPSGPPAPAPANNPTMRATQQVQPPERVGLPQSPQLTPTKTIGPEDVQAANATELAKRTAVIRKTVNRAAVYVTGYRSLAAIGRAMSGDVGALSALPADVGEGMALAAGGNGLASLLESPKVSQYLTKPTPAQVATINPEIARDLAPIVQAAKQKGIKISPALAAAISANSSKDKWWDRPTQ